MTDVLVADLLAFEQCPERWQRQGSGQPWPAAPLWRMVRAATLACLHSGHTDEESICAHWASLWAEAKLPDGHEFYAQGCEAVAKLVQVPDEQWADGSYVVGKRTLPQPLKLALDEEREAQIIVDYILRTDETVFAVQFRAGERRFDAISWDAELAATYEAVASEWPDCAVVVRRVAMNKQIVQTYEGEPLHIEAGRAYLAALAQLMERPEEPRAIVGVHCSDCPIASECDAFDAWQTVAERDLSGVSTADEIARVWIEAELKRQLFVDAQKRLAPPLRRYLADAGQPLRVDGHTVSMDAEMRLILS